MIFKISVNWSILLLDLFHPCQTVSVILTELTRAFVWFLSIKNCTSSFWILVKVCR